MKLTLRKFLFWPHLVCGLVAGLVIALLALTGVVLVFEKPVVRWADDARTVSVPPDPQRLPVDELITRANAVRPGKTASAVAVAADPTAAVLVNFGREDGVYVDPYSGEVRPLGAPRARAFFHWVTDLHRFLLGEGDRRAVGKAITGASNLVFLFLGLTGLYLWFPRKWAWRAYRPALWFHQGLNGKARDFSWHNVIGFWCLPVLIVLTASGAVISYKWASDFVYRAMGHEPPAQGPGAAPVVKVPTPVEGTVPATMDALFASAAVAVPGYETITWRAPQGGGSGGPAKAVALSVRLKDAPPQSATVQLSVDPNTSAVLAREGYAEANSGRKLRMWLRFLHTGEALGPFGQAIAALASFGALFLVYTGIALAIRRLFPRKKPATVPAVIPEGQASPS